jgi:hypothetical protein
MPLTTQRLNDIRPQTAPVQTEPTPQTSASGLQGFVQRNPKAAAPAAPPKNALGVAADVADATFGRAANFLFGTTAKTVGSLVGSGVESGMDLVGIKNPHTFTKIADKELTGLNAAKNIAFTTLELWPGGKTLSTAMKGTKLAPYLEDFAKVFKFIPDALKEHAIAQYSKALAPTKEFLKRHTEKIVPELLERRVMGLSINRLLDRAKTELFEAGDKLDNALSMVPEGLKIRTESILNDLEEMKAKAMVKGTKVVAEPGLLNSINEVKGVISELGDEVSFESLRSLRQIWDRAITSGGKAFGRTMTEDSLLNIKRAANDSIRAELAKAAPEVAKVNAEFTFWSRVKEVTEATAERKTGQSGELIPTIAEGAGTVIGLASKKGLLGVAAGAVLMRNLKKLMTSTAWRTFSAVQKAKLADALSVGNIEAAMAIVGKLTAEIHNATDGENRD